MQLSALNTYYSLTAPKYFVALIPMKFTLYCNLILNYKKLVYCGTEVKAGLLLALGSQIFYSYNESILKYWEKSLHVHEMSFFN